MTIFREKNQVKEVGTGLECGISIKDFIGMAISNFQKIVKNSYASTNFKPKKYGKAKVKT